MHGQESTGVNLSFQKKMNGYHNSWIRKKVVLWQETSQDTRSRGKLLARSFETIRNDDSTKNSFAPKAKDQDSSGQSLKEMYCRIGEDVNDGFGILLHHAKSTHYLGVIEIPKQNFDLQAHSYWSSSGVKVICHHNVSGLEIQIPSTSGDNTKVSVVISRRLKSLRG